MRNIVIRVRVTKDFQAKHKLSPTAMTSSLLLMHENLHMVFSALLKQVESPFTTS